MKDLQDLLDGTTLENLNAFSAKMEPEKLQENADTIWQIIVNMYFEETDEWLNTDTCTAERMDELFGHLRTMTAMHIAVRQGHMIQVSGRMKLSDPNNATFSLTDRGKNYVEKKLL
jgi:hypothetical protein